MASLIGNKSGPCPQCGSMGTVPSGVYRAIGPTLEVLFGEDRETLQRLLGKVETLRQQDTPDSRQVDEALASEPVGSRLKAYLPQNAQELGTYLLVLAMVLRILLGGGGPDPQAVADEVVDQLEVYAEGQGDGAADPDDRD